MAKKEKKPKRAVYKVDLTRDRGEERSMNITFLIAITCRT